MVENREVNQEVLSITKLVTKQDINKFCEEEGLLYVETSALSGEGVYTLFKSIGSCY